MLPPPRPTLDWHTTENERFVERRNYLTDDRTYEDDSDTGEEEDDNEEGEDRLSVCLTTSEDDTTEEAEMRAGYDMAMPTSEDSESNHQASISIAESRVEESIVSKFLEVIDDHDTHHACIQRLQDFFYNASLEQMGQNNEESEEGQSCQCVLDERNITSHMFRRYPKPLVPVKVYEKLMKNVSFFPS